MRYGTEARIPQGMRVGTRERNYETTDERTHLVIASDEEAAQDLITKSLGELVGRSFSFGEVDKTHAWFREFTLGRNGLRQPYIDALIDTQAMLGSIEITGARLSLIAGGLVAFWVTSKEGSKERVLVGERGLDDERYHPLAPEFEFEPMWISQAIAAQY